MGALKADNFWYCVSLQLTKCYKVYKVFVKVLIMNSEQYYNFKSCA